MGTQKCLDLFPGPSWPSGRTLKDLPNGMGTLGVPPTVTALGNAGVPPTSLALQRDDPPLHPCSPQLLKMPRQLPACLSLSRPFRFISSGAEGKQLLREVCLVPHFIPAALIEALVKPF